MRHLEIALGGACLMLGEIAWVVQCRMSLEVLKFFKSASPNVLGPSPMFPVGEEHGTVTQVKN